MRDPLTLTLAPLAGGEGTECLLFELVLLGWAAAPPVGRK